MRLACGTNKHCSVSFAPPKLTDTAVTFTTGERRALSIRTVVYALHHSVRRVQLWPLFRVCSVAKASRVQRLKGTLGYACGAPNGSKVGFRALASLRREAVDACERRREW